jgi:ATP-dependent exoDNAse (exonuclease V) beta subunit
VFIRTPQLVVRARAAIDERVADAADKAELDDIYKTERRLLYVACTRAREHLLLTGVAPVSEYLSDLQTTAG